MGNWKRYTFSVPSGATVSENQAIAPCSRMTIVLSNVTAFNAGAGNMQIRVRGGMSLTDATYAVFKMPDDSRVSITTETSKGCYPIVASGGVFTVQGFPFMQINIVTAVTGSQSNTVDLITYTETGS